MYILITVYPIRVNVMDFAVITETGCFLKI